MADGWHFIKMGRKENKRVSPSRSQMRARSQEMSSVKDWSNASRTKSMRRSWVNARVAYAALQILPTHFLVRCRPDAQSYPRHLVPETHALTPSGAHLWAIRSGTFHETVRSGWLRPVLRARGHRSSGCIGVRIAHQRSTRTSRNGLVGLVDVEAFLLSASIVQKISSMLSAI